MSETSHFFNHPKRESAPDQISMPSAEDFAAMAQIREAEETVRRAEIADWRKAEKRKQWKGRMKKVMAATALLATVKSGGLMDMAADPFVDAGDVATSAIDVAPVSLPDSLDGIAFEDFSKRAQRDMTQEAKEVHDNELRAQATVISLFERADSEGYAGIVAETSNEKAEHPELFVDQSIATEALERIEESETNAAAVEALEDYMRHFEMSAEFHDGVVFDERHDQVAEAAKAYVNVFSKLPKDLVGMARLSTVTISSSGITDNQDHVGAEGGAYTGDAINITALPPVLDAMMPIESRFQFDDMGYESHVAHELGHALAHELKLAAHLDEDEIVTEGPELADMDFAARGSGIARGALGYPEYVSTYGRYSTAENTAEVLAGVLSNRRNGLAEVGETREFKSPANASMIDMLAQLEQVRPGIAKILIASRVS